ncbi:MAG: hypothetical protein J6Y74_04510 [Clostridia bacterium]|nr:hypothetical protein [Clostridia bacterium]
MSDFSLLQAKIGYSFKDETLLARALTHSSASTDNYERLEFLGDSLVNYVVSDILYRESALEAGEMSKTRASMVSKEPLSFLSDELGFSAACRRKNCALSVKMKCDLYEAVTAAICLDGGIREAVDFVQRTIRTLPFRAKDYKSELKELCEKHRWSYHAPNTVSVTKKGQVFTVEVYVDGKSVGVGKGGSIRAAENEACKPGLAKISEG